LGEIVDPTLPTPEKVQLRAAAEGLAAIPEITVDSLAIAVRAHTDWVPALGLTVGLGQEKLKNALKEHFDSQSWSMLARERPVELIEVLDRKFNVIRLLTEQRHATYDFADVLIARAGPRVTAASSAKTGIKVEDAIEGIAKELGLSYRMRTRFIGTNQQDAPCDLAIPGGGSEALIVVAAKGFDSTGSKLTAAFTEINTMASVRRPNQFVYAVLDGIGWLSRGADLRRIFESYEQQRISGLYSLAMLDRFRADLERAAKILDLL
jgi:hypothetical protein